MICRCLLLILGWMISASVVSAGRPNILLIVSEDNGPELGCYGDPFAKTPHLNQLAREGLRFERAFVPQAGCSQSRASFLTGLYPHQHGQTQSHGQHGGDHAPGIGQAATAVQRVIHVHRHVRTPWLFQPC